MNYHKITGYIFALDPTDNRSGHHFGAEWGDRGDRKAAVSAFAAYFAEVAESENEWLSEIEADDEGMSCVLLKPPEGSERSDDAEVSSALFDRALADFRADPNIQIEHGYIDPDVYNAVVDAFVDEVAMCAEENGDWDADEDGGGYSEQGHPLIRIPIEVAAMLKGRWLPQGHPTLTADSVEAILESVVPDYSRAPLAEHLEGLAEDALRERCPERFRGA